MANLQGTREGVLLAGGVHAPEYTAIADLETFAVLPWDTSFARVFCRLYEPDHLTDAPGTEFACDSRGLLRRLHAGLPDNCLFLVDEAYAVYATAEDYDTGTTLADEYENVVVTRTFSKIYGLPSLRIGWAYCSAGIIDPVQRIRTPFNTNGAAMAAAAAAVKDTAYIEEIRAHNASWRERISSSLTGMGIEVAPSQANFYLLRFAKDSNKSGGAAGAFLQSRGIIPRPASGSDEFLRITIGLDHENEAVLNALSDYMSTP